MVMSRAAIRTGQVEETTRCHAKQRVDFTEGPPRQQPSNGGALAGPTHPLSFGAPVIKGNASLSLATILSGMSTTPTPSSFADRDKIQHPGTRILPELQHQLHVHLSYARGQGASTLNNTCLVPTAG